MPNTGNVALRASNTLGAGIAVVAPLLKPEAMNNEALYIHYTLLTQNQLLAMAEGKGGSNLL